MLQYSANTTQSMQYQLGREKKYMKPDKIREASKDKIELICAFTAKGGGLPKGISPADIANII